MAISKKQANKIATLINTCTVYTMMVNSAMEKNEPNTKIRSRMQTHDEAAKELNEILGVTAVALYNIGVYHA